MRKRVRRLAATLARPLHISLTPHSPRDGTALDQIPDRAHDPGGLRPAALAGLRGTLRERERAQAELVASCTHEFRKPVNINAGYAELLLAHGCGGLPAEAVRPVRSIGGAARRIGDMVSDFLRYAKREAGVDTL